MPPATLNILAALRINSPRERKLRPTVQLLALGAFPDGQVPSIALSSLRGIGELSQILDVDFILRPAGDLHLRITDVM